ncbi:NADH-quinone oxidoreductase subunit NuoH [candidate division GN15 bacterium]|jgi:NADH-quinone oxidoreductase subunit H|nr:NADH-quinone oxidoreductase subunit NuoH [candidate division GN15 bacterium]
MWLHDLLESTGIGEPWSTIISYGFLAVTVFGTLSILALFLVWWERKIAGHIQQRFGPMRTGWHGWYQTIMDAVKLLQKEDIRIATRDKAVFFWAPVVCFVAAYLAYVVIPFGENLIVADLNVGILYIIAVTTFTVISLLMAGWGSNNKYALLGGMRSAAQVVSYEVPMAVSILTVIVFAGSLSMVDIANAQQGNIIFNWFIFKPPFGIIAFLTYITAATAEANRTPFDIPEAEQELVAGYNVEYSGMKFAMFFLAEFVNLFTVSAIAVTLFFGGWHGPLLPSWIWFLLKTFAVILLLMLFRWTFPRLRVDQLMEFAWKFLVPLTFANLILAGWFKYAGWHW